MIKSIKIENFRSIKSLTIKPSQLCALIGPNSCGKTNILKSIDLVLGEGWATKAKVARELFNDVTQPISIRIDLTEPIKWNYYSQSKTIRTVTLEMTLEPLECKVRLWENYPMDNSNKGYYLNEEFKKACHFIYLPSTRDLYQQMRVSNWTLLGKMMRTIYENYVEHSGGEEKIKSDFANIIAPAKEFLQKDFNKEALTFHRFVETVTRYCKANSAGLGTDFTIDFDIYNINWFYKTLQISVSEDTTDKTFDWEEVGSGMQNLILLSVFQTYGELSGGRAILAIEEPEVFLYPHAQRVLYKTFQRISEKSQIFYTTHNPNFVDAMRADEIEILRKNPSEGTMLLQRDNIVTPDFLRREEFRIYTQFNPERNEIFFANKILLVEGESDKRLWEVLVPRKMQKDLDEEGISVIECGGKGGVIYFLGVLRLLGMRDYFAVWDQDKDADDKFKHLDNCLQEKRGLIVRPNLEGFLRDRFPEFTFTGERKVEQTHRWAESVPLEKIPTEFQPVFDFIGGERQEATANSELPF